MVEAGDRFHDDIKDYGDRLFPDNMDWGHLLEVHFFSKVRAAHALHLNSITSSESVSKPYVVCCTISKDTVYPVSVFLNKLPR
jgi:hypothetical protein